MRRREPMKRECFGSKSNATRRPTRGRRLLAAAGLLALAVGFPSPAQAFVCKVVDYRVCGRCICCLLTCVNCYDQTGALLDSVCGETYCYNNCD
jgi:hypothetical protein